MATTTRNVRTGGSMARDVFMYLLMIFVLGWSATALGTILFSVIDKYIPVAGAPLSYLDYGQVVRFPVASLVIMFPALVWIIWSLKRDMAANPAKRELKIRKWLLYLTLFVTGIIMLGDLVALVYSFLQGDITSRFLLKVVTVFWISGSIFYYFLQDLHDRSPSGRRVVEWVTVAITVAALVAGFWMAGSPAANRAKANDQQRVSNLQMLEQQVINYWQAKQQMPPSLNALADGTIGGSGPLPADPVSGQPFEYRVTGSTSYEFCATFQAASDPNDMSIARPAIYGSMITTWQHGAGYTCFQGTIDPDRYPPFIKK